MTLGERIASLRKEKGMSQEGLGELVGVSRQAVSKWEADRALPDVHNCVAISQALGVSLADLLELEEAQAVSTDESANTLENDRESSVSSIHSADGAGEHELSPSQLHVLEKMIDTYAAAQKKLRHRWRWPLILAGCVLAVGVAWLWQWLTDMNQTIEYLHGEVAGLRSEIISGVSDQLQDSFGKNHLEAKYRTRIKQVDLTKNQITYILEAEFTEPVLIYRLQFMIRQGDSIWEADMKSAGGLKNVGEITCPIQDDTALYVVVEEEDGTIHREKVAVWNPEEQYMLHIHNVITVADLKQIGLVPGAAEIVRVYIGGFAHGYGQGELTSPLQLKQAEVAVLCNQDTIAVQNLDIGNLELEEDTGRWDFQGTVEIAVPDDMAEEGDILTFELRVEDSHGRNFTRIISQYQVQQDGTVSEISNESAEVIE